MKHLTLLCTLAMLATPAPAMEDGRVWATATATRPSDGRVIIYRFIQEYQPSFDRSKYPLRVTVSWSYTPSPTGMPSKPEHASMDMLEDLLVPELDKSSLASLAVVRTGDNLRQWVYYARNERAFRSTLGEALKAMPSAPVEVQVLREPGWETYQQFVGGIRK